ncbi:hypothetical protein RB653_000269 [Dictyostelium firmibasis]|uniref:Rab GTPase domain-containing protein n=1 Tax=Dictyostelium firmibasis TaxID=79012 RepID=A0AAN7TUV6_9MYCE
MSYLSNLRERIFGNGNNGTNNNNDSSSNNMNYSNDYGANDITFRSEFYQSVDRVRVLVIGDTAVGKSSLVHLICNDQALTRSPSWTVGCNTDVRIHEYHSKDYYIEFVDIGGSTKYKITRPILYHQISGIIVVYDLTNKISLKNVKKWIFDVLNKISPNQTSSNYKLKETESNQVLELENTTDSLSNSSVNINDNNNSNDNSGYYYQPPIQSPTTSTITTTTTTTQQTPNLRRLNFINSHSKKNLGAESTVNITNSIRPTFLSQTSLFLPSNTQSPTIQSPINTNKKKSININNNNNSYGNCKSLNNIPVLIMGNKCDLYFDRQSIESDSLGKLSLLVSAKSSQTFSQSSYNLSRLEIFYNKMISNLISNKRGGNPTHMSFNNQIYNTFLNSPSPTNNNNNNNSNNNNNNSANINYMQQSPPIYSSQHSYPTENDYYNLNNSNIQSNSPPSTPPPQLFNQYITSNFTPQQLMPPPSFIPTHNNNNNNNNTNNIIVNNNNKTPLRSRSTSFERSAKNF